MVQIGSNWFKLDQDESDWLFGSNQIKLVQIGTNKIGSNWINLVKSGSNEINFDQIDQTGSNQIK